jgi:hypothetical protein
MVEALLRAGKGAVAPRAAVIAIAEDFAEDRPGAGGGEHLGERRDQHADDGAELNARIGRA